MEEGKGRSPYQPPQETCSLHVYTRGTITDRGHLKCPAATNRAFSAKRRSGITTLSKASASRLRRLLATTKGPEGWPCFGMTLTIPGPPISVAEWRKVFRAYRGRLVRLGDVALIWRIELQERGQPHLHCVCWGRKGSARLREHWLEVLALLGPCEGPAEGSHGGSLAGGTGDGGKAEPASVIHRGYWRGARKHAVKIKGLRKKDGMGWWRYLASHTSKSKQAQLGWQGRQWGIVNRGLLDRYKPVLIELPSKAMFKVLRYLKKIANCRFASGHGRQTWFVFPTTTKRLCEWAMAENGNWQTGQD